MAKYAPKGPLKAPDDPMDLQHSMRVTCKATNRKGMRCRRSPIPGGVVCRFHGGSAPQVRAKALERLMQYQDRAINRLFGLVEQEQYPSTAYQAVRDVLDRTMGKPAEQVRVTGADDGPIEIIIKKPW